jgi:hypothetical protein
VVAGSVDSVTTTWLEVDAADEGAAAGSSTAGGPAEAISTTVGCAVREPSTTISTGSASAMASRIASRPRGA